MLWLKGKLKMEKKNVMKSHNKLAIPSMTTRKQQLMCTLVL